MPQMNDDGSLWHVDSEIESLLVLTAEESERRGTDFLGDFESEGVDILVHSAAKLAEAAGFDGSCIARLVKICAYQQRHIEQLEAWVERQGGD